MHKNYVKAINIKGEEIVLDGFNGFKRNLLEILEIDKNTQFLWIENNHLSSLPTNQLNELDTLSCNNNKITKLPPLTNYPKLKWVRCDLITFEPYMLNMNDVVFEFVA